MRARSLKPGFFTNEFLVALGPATALLFQGLWCMADRRGVLEDRPGKIKLSLPLIGDLDVDKALDSLQRPPNRFIRRYTARGVRLIKILNFRKHQNPHVHEKPSEFPDYQGVGCWPGTSRDKAVLDIVGGDAPTVPAPLTPSSQKAREEAEATPKANNSVDNLGKRLSVK